MAVDNASGAPFTARTALLRLLVTSSSRNAMWCRQCRQDVPAARNASGPHVCSRCQATLAAPARESLTLASAAECGVALEEFDRPAEQAASWPSRPAPAADDDSLRRLRRLLRPQRRSDLSHCSPLGREPVPTDASDRFPLVGLIGQPLRAAAVDRRRALSARRGRSAWGINLLLALGAVTFACGAMLLAAANMLVHAVAWRWGFAMTIVGEGLLIAALTAMALRLWRNSRRLNSQLDDIDRRLGDVQSSIQPPSALASLEGDALWRLDAAEPLGQFGRGAVAVR